MKQQRLKLKQYLTTVKKYVPHCVECGTTEDVDTAHYSGLYSDRLGNGMGSKSHDYCVARLCRKHHRELDQYAHGNGESRAREFIDYIHLTLAELVATREQFIAVPDDLKQHKWLDRLKNGLDKHSGKDAVMLINHLAGQRDFVEKSGK